MVEREEKVMEQMERQAEATRVVTFEARTMPELHEEVNHWIEAHESSMKVLSFSQSVQERRGGHPMGAGRTIGYGGALLVEPTDPPRND